MVAMTTAPLTASFLSSSFRSENPLILPRWLLWPLQAFTATLWWSTRGMQRATLETIELARQEFVATHRPRVILRYIQGPFYNDEGHRFIWLTFVNRR
jgi:hypothetical protein